MNPLKILLAPDSFKESMSASIVCTSMEKGLRKVFPEVKVISIPMSDGGEGLLECLISATQGQIFTVQVTGPLQEPIVASFGVMGDQETVVIEVAQACGLSLVPLSQRNPLKTTSFGVGQLIMAALEVQPKRMIIGLGGSATNDAGLGMLSALGVKFYNDRGEDLKLGGAYLNQLVFFNLTGLDQRLSKLDITIACDVSNPLTGPFGASYVYGPQKGADPKMVELLDHQLKHVAQVFKNQLGVDIDAIKGAGAAGGMGSTLMAILHATLSPGIETVMELVDFEAALKDVSLVLTGEGCIDSQSAYGKTISGVALSAQKRNIPVFAFAGKIEGDISPLFEMGIHDVIGIVARTCPLQQALNEGPINIELVVEKTMRLLKESRSYQIKE